MPEGRPRGIRDIAHLYLSRMEAGRGQGAAPATICAAALERDCMPGFHVANLALACARRGCVVRVVEASGVHPNAGFFLALPPSIYAAGTSAGTVSAVDNVTIVFGAHRSASACEDAVAAAGPPDRRRRVDIVHRPPGAQPGGEEGALSLWIVASTPDAALVETSERDALLVVGGLGERGRDPRVVSRVGRWHSAVADPVPVLVRAPDSRLARCYVDACDALLARIDRHFMERTRAERLFRLRGDRGGLAAG